MRVKITLACAECKQRNYNTKKNKKNCQRQEQMNPKGRKNWHFYSSKSMRSCRQN